MHQMEKPIESIICTLDLDIRKLLFLHLLVVYRENDNVVMLKYIRDNIQMRSFVMTEIDERFWYINHCQYTINYLEHNRLEVFEGVYAIINHTHIKHFAEILNMIKQKGSTLAYFYFTPKGLALTFDDNILGDGVAIECERFVVYHVPKVIFSIKVNVDNMINKLSGIDGDMLFRVKRNRVQILSHTAN